jgi:hypothetical protein
MPEKPENEAVTPDSEGERAEVVNPRLIAKSTSSAKLRVQLFKEAVRSVHVRPSEEGWEVFRVGTDPIAFPEKSQAIEFAEKNAKIYKVNTVLHEEGNAHTITRSDD